MENVNKLQVFLFFTSAVILSGRKIVFWQSILDIPYRVLIYADSPIAMVGNQHNHTLCTLLWLQFRSMLVHCKFSSCMELLKCGSIELGQM